MKKLFFLILFFSINILIFGANVYFENDGYGYIYDNGRTFYSNQDVYALISYHIIVPSLYYVCDPNSFGARFKDPDGNWSSWGYTDGYGGHECKKAGTWYVQGRAYVTEDFTGRHDYWMYTSFTLDFNVVDTNHYAISSAYITGPTSINLNQNYTWNAEASPSNVYTPLSYQWWYENLGGASPASSLSISPDLPGTGTWYKIGTNSSSLTTSFSANSAIYCVVTDGQGNSATSNTLTLTVNLSRIAKTDDTAIANKGLVNESVNIGSQAEDETIPTKYSLSDNYPNPFNPSTVIQYELPNNGFVSLKVYDILGDIIETLVNQYQAKGRYSIKFNANNLSSGIYLYRLQSGSFIATKKMLLQK